MGHEFGSFLDTICKLSSADPWSVCCCCGI